MEYIIKTISDKSQIEACSRFEIDKRMWPERNVYSPKAYGYMGFIPEKGLYCKLVAEESNPLARVSEYHGRVCNDSAMEVFLAFPLPGEERSTDVLYMNFEVNSLGVMFAKGARGRKNRSFFSPELEEKCEVNTVVEADKWSLDLVIPLELLNGFSEVPEMKTGAEFYVNFYKISETPEVEHYESFTEILTEQPNFHCPEYFAKAVIE